MDDLFAVDAAPDANIQKRIRKRPPKKKRQVPSADKLERNLARAVFGGRADDEVEDEMVAEEVAAAEGGVGGADVFDEEDDDDNDGDDAADDDDDAGDGEDDDDDDAAARRGGEGKRAKREAKVRQAAWVDEDDGTQEVAVAKGASRLRKLRQTKAEASLGGDEYVHRLRAQFASVQPDASWAALPAGRQHRRFGDDADDDDAGDDDATAPAGDDDDDDADDDAVLRSGNSLLGKGRVLPHDAVSVRRMTDLNAEEPSASISPIVQWHPNAQLALTAGPDQKLRLFRVDGVTNTKIQSVHLPNLPISSASFTPDGAQVLICGQSKQWCIFDLHAASLQRVPGVMGRQDKAFKQLLPSPDGSVLAMVTESNALLLLSAKTKQLIATLQTASAGKWNQQSIAFSPDGGYLHAASVGSKVQVWDVQRRCCVHSWADRGGVRVTAMDTSADGELVAVGSDSGAVNLYRSTDLLRSERPPPLKEFLNVRSAITHVTFNPTSEMVSFASKYVKSAFRLAHVGRQAVFSNWPTAKTPLNYVQTAAFSPHSGFMATGNDKGKVLLYRLNHYDQA